MTRALTRSLVGSIPKPPTTSFRARPIASQELFSFASGSRTLSVPANRRRTFSVASAQPANARNELNVPNQGRLSIRRFTLSSIARREEDTKEKNAPSNPEKDRAYDDKAASDAALEERIANIELPDHLKPKVEIPQMEEVAAPPEDIPQTKEGTTPNTEGSMASVASTPKEADTDSASEAKDKPALSSPPQSAIWDHIRRAQASLPSFDGLTSSTSLSSLLATASSRSRELVSQARSKLSNLSAQYNTFSGYAAIEDLKQRIVVIESTLDEARAAAATAKKAYLASVQARSTSQRETNDLLSRKNSWTEADLSRYTELLRKEHALSREEAESEKELERSEAEVQVAFDELMKAVMVRYHEEQVWSDRMRGWSTYGSLLVAGLNAFLFIIAILLVEPYKRKKLAQTFEERLVKAEEQSREMILQSVATFQTSLNAALAPPFKPVEENVEAEETLTTSRPTLVEVGDQVAPVVEAGTEKAELETKRYRQEEERLVFASTLGVVVGAALSLLISACWS